MTGIVMEVNEKRIEFVIVSYKHLL